MVTQAERYSLQQLGLALHKKTLLRKFPEHTLKIACYVAPHATPEELQTALNQGWDLL